MIDFQTGQVVISKAGRDKGDVFIVIGVDMDFLQLVDGKGRPYANPKKKKKKHVQPTKTVDTSIKKALSAQVLLKDSDFRNALKLFKGAREV